MWTAYGGSIDFEHRVISLDRVAREIQGFQERGVYTMARSLWLVAGFILFASTLSFASSASLYYSDGPWMGKIIDAETKEPIEGAVVLAVWKKIYATPAGDNSYFFDAREVLTDTDGKFFIKEFKAINFIPVIRRLDGPDFTVFKPGYVSFGHNLSGYYYFNKYFPNSHLRVDSPTLRKLFKTGIIIELLKLKTREERIDVLPTPVDPFSGHNDKKKNYIRLLNSARKELGLEPYPAGE